MNTQSPAKESKFSNDYENNSHIGKKKKAIANQFQKKNHKDIVNLINDEDDQVSAMYARYIR